MKILVISHSCVVDVNQQIYVALNDIVGTEVALLIPANWRSEYTGEALHSQILPSVRFPVYQVPVVKPGHVSLYAYLRLPVAKLREWKPDVILSTQEPWSLSNLQAMWLARVLGVPFAFQTNQNIRKNYPPPFSWIEAASFKRASLALAYSEEAKQVMTQKGLAVPSAVVPYATDTSMFTSRNTIEMRARLGLGDAVVAGFLGRLVPEKGLDTLISAIARIKEMSGSLLGNRSIKVLLVGTGNAEDELRNQAKSLGVADDVIFTGVVPHSEAPNYMSCVDIFVLPSRTTPTWKEQFGRVIIEALACGVPVVGSDSGQIPVLIRETGGGCVFPEGDVDALSTVLSQLVRNESDRRHLAEVGKKSVAARFTCEAVARQLHDLLSGICASVPVGVSNTVGANPAQEVSQ